MASSGTKSTPTNIQSTSTTTTIKTPPAATTTTTTTKTTTYKTFLFDLAEDPYEANNLLDDPTGAAATKYADITTQMSSRHEYFSQFITDPDPPVFNAALTAFRSCGGVCSYVENTIEETETVAKNLMGSGNPTNVINPQAPNIVFVLLDDWGWNDVGWRSNYMSWTTPNIDRLASEGVKLENYYSAYYCIPARASLLTGRYAIRHGTWDNSFESNEHLPHELSLDETTIAQEMQVLGFTPTSLQPFYPHPQTLKTLIPYSNSNLTQT